MPQMGANAYILYYLQKTTFTTLLALNDDAERWEMRIGHILIYRYITAPTLPPPPLHTCHNDPGWGGDTNLLKCQVCYAESCTVYQARGTSCWMLVVVLNDSLNDVIIKSLPLPTCVGT